ncbi:ATP-dependent dethiobiotin synthetase BioD [Ochrobactrum sp. Q0168]|uniref:dethiobiotin synthase n=1 Tax=Ochrobactrum sp. Q0168 TaxID=2793241 RepID=UPI0018ECD779|nr:ATP-dependent dethiobiotin synthetase BioD [Ochrobactrum sp. Q0168]
MTTRFVVSGTDTGIGKTVFSAALTAALDGSYWKPVQSGLDAETDSEAVAKLAGLPQNRILPEAYRLSAPLSPHQSAALDSTAISADALTVPEIDGPLVIEGAGGLLVPLSDQLVFADIFAQWQIPVIVCARTNLGTINHTLLSVEALKHRRTPIGGIAFIGDENPETQRIIAKMSGVRVLGRLPLLPSLSEGALMHAFEENFDLGSFAEVCA